MSTGGSGSGVCFGPRDTDKPFADSERAQKWRLSLASLLFFTVLLSDHLWLCVEARQVAAGRHRDRERRAEPGGALPSFCNSYTLRELFAGLSRPDMLNCTVDRDRRSGEEEDWLRSCRRCVLVYQRYDRQAQDRYREFELVLQKYLQAEEYSVKSGPEDCKTVYKAWLCSQYFEVTQSHCNNTIPCKQYCLEVQTRCPFILPDNDDVIYGGLSSFICTGLYDNYPTNAEPECCDVRWGLLSDNQSKGTIKTSDSMMCHRTSLTVSSASRLCNSRLKLCVLVLILLHTVLTVSAAQNSTELGFGGITNFEDNSTNEE
ncbi:transmembrane protein FAM155A [Thamnophis elegans]|uniref:transmembrane protein FAM155A n=1 Tax=Thamnophis elegans TaxID=35005 RepID=UPI001376C72A|nr:transmembrane protein FAM155A [Thamnophis elegans]